jgi:glyceraldehyde 3-phosphate dehydrogenase
MRYFQERDPANLPWGDLEVDVVMECTGAFTKRDGAAKHLDAGAKKVLISAPGKGADLTIVMGVNHDDLMPEHAVISNASCTTNCLAPLAKALNDGLGIARGYMTTVHAVTGDQHTVDKNHKDLRRARAAGDNIIPTTTGAAKAAGLVIPELNGKLDGVAIRVPTVNVSLVDFTFDAARATDVGEVQRILREAAASPRYAGIIGINDEPLVSSDFNHNPNSATVDINDTQVIDGTLVRVQAWYDNEWGFSHRMCDAAAAVGTLVK